MPSSPDKAFRAGEAAGYLLQEKAVPNGHKRYVRRWYAGYELGFVDGMKRLDKELLGDLYDA